MKSSVIRLVGICFAAAIALFGSAELRSNFEALADEAMRAYLVQGEIRQLPKAPGGEVFIKHDPIPDYIDETGAKVGMGSMTMPFWLAKDVSLEGLAVGDRVEFKLEAQLKPVPRDLITSIRKIAPVS